MQVSMLMAEEKRRCHDVFGPTLAPSVLSSLVVETFDPLTNSYQNRLSHQLTFPEVVNLCGDTTQVGSLLKYRGDLSGEYPVATASKRLFLMHACGMLFR